MLHQFIMCFQWLQPTFKVLFISIWSIWVSSNKILTTSSFYQGYVKIHPPLQYIGSLLTTYLIMSKKTTYNLKIYITALILIISFILGSLWALFQSIWGYYWSNDTIEYILLLFLIFILFKLHKYYLNNSIFNNILLIYTLFLLICLRINILYTKHNFFIKTGNLKYFLFFFQIIFLWKIKFQNKFKQLWLNYKSKILWVILIIIFNNKLNSFWVKNTLMYSSYIFSYIYIFSVIKITKNKLIHIVMYLTLILYILFLIKYISGNKYNFFINKYKFHLFYTTKSNSLNFFNKTNLIAFKLKFNTHFIKNFNYLNFIKLNLKKLCNYF